MATSTKKNKAQAVKLKQHFRYNPVREFDRSK